MMSRLIVLEGLDGSGKATQSQFLADRFIENGFNVRKISFPDYESPSSTLVRMYLNGELGTLDEVNPYAASSFYSLDRYISFHKEWEKEYKSDFIIISDRYTTSNICHQMCKFPRDRWEEYIRWLYEYEYNLLGIPSPDMVIYLDMPPQAASELIKHRYNGDENKKDLHERDLDYLLRCARLLFMPQKSLAGRWYAAAVPA
jgi:dTMP kinase